MIVLPTKIRVIRAIRDPKKIGSSVGWIANRANFANKGRFIWGMKLIRAFALNMQVIFAGLFRGIFAVSLWQVRF